MSEYATGELGGGAVYKGYRPKSAILEQVSAALPSAQVVVVSGSWCPDCRREVPKIARILEGLPEGWTVETQGDDVEARAKFGVRAIPTFIVQDAATGSELGRIIETPRRPDGFEGDFLASAQAARDSAIRV